MEIDKLLKIQSQRGAKLTSGGADSNTTSFEKVTNDVRKAIEEQSNRYRNLDPVRKKEEIKAIIVDYVMNNKPLVDGYLDSENNSDTMKLVNALVQDITDYGILTVAMEREDIFEIRANGKEIKVEINGKVQDLTDVNGNIVSFESVEQQEIILKKLLGDVKLTPKDALVNASTIEGFRIAAVHASALSADVTDTSAEKYHAFVLRKFKKQRMNLGEIVRKKTLSDNMARTLALCPAGGLTFFTVGPTASGKTTTNNAILLSVPKTTRTILIQNPSEIDLRMKEGGRVVNDVLHMEAREIENPTASDPTAVNEMDHSLRLSPTFVCFGELRTNKEFKLAMKILTAGHPLNATYHSDSARGAVSRFLTAYLSESGNEPSHLALKSLTDLVNIIIVQKIMRDGKRRIIQITEVVGVDPNDRDQPLLNDLFRFDIDREPEYDDAGNVVAIHGKHKRVGKLSERTIEKLKLEGVSRSRFDFLLNDPSETEVETYTGKNIEKYGMKTESLD
jgi:pilus assembly protein CpaF